MRSCLLLLFWVANLAGGQAELPATRAGERFASWLSALNSQDPKLIQEFITNHHADPPPVEAVLRMARQTGGFDFLKTLESSEHKLSVLVRARTLERYARVVLETQPEPPHRVLPIRIMGVRRPLEYAPARMSEDEALAALKAEAAKQAERDHFSGAVLVAKNGRTLFKDAYGMADRSLEQRNKVDTRFRIGSMNKMFTATAILQLVQAGKLALNDPVGKILPDYPNSDVASKVTIHHLLTHTGGTGDIFGPQFDEHRLALRDLSDYVKLYGKRALDFEPGAQFRYSNYGFLLLGAIVEKVSGQSYYDYVRANIFKPAGMTGTDSLPESEKVEARATGYMRGPGAEWKPNTDTLPFRGTSAGGGYSTVEDLTRFANALLGHKLLDAKHTELLITSKVNAGDDKYAYGFFDQNTSDGVRYVGHGGGAPGMNGDLRIFPESGYVVAVLANSDPPAADRIGDYIADRLPVGK